MTLFRTSLDIAFDVLAACMWGLAAFFVGARLTSVTGGTLLAMAVFVTALVYVTTSRIQENRARDLARGACPRCHQALVTEHEHRRWDPSNQNWLPPAYTWLCLRCGFEQEEALACELCPA